MFGYIKPFEAHMRMCDYETYTSACRGFRKAMKKNYGLSLRMSICGDFALLGLLELSLNGAEADIVNIRSFTHFFKKIPCLITVNGMDFTCASAAILVYNNILDDIEDSRFLKKHAAKRMLKRSYKAYVKASEKYPDLAEYVSEQMENQKKLEKENCKTVDRASEPASNILSEIASRLSTDPEKKRILRRFGFLLARYIYIADAFDDVEEDFRRRGFNPLIRGNYVINDIDLPAIQKKTEDSVNFTLGALADCYVQLDIERFKPVIDNIVYLGLKNGFYDLIKEKEEMNEE